MLEPWKDLVRNCANSSASEADLGSQRTTDQIGEAEINVSWFVEIESKQR